MPLLHVCYLATLFYLCSIRHRSPDTSTADMEEAIKEIVGEELRRSPSSILLLFLAAVLCHVGSCDYIGIGSGGGGQGGRLAPPTLYTLFTYK